MEPQRGSQGGIGGYGAWVRREALITPNPKLKLLQQVREVMRLKHYSIRTERSYCDWIRRFYTHVLRQGGAGMKSPPDAL
jgi:hypothetical protein